MSKRTILCVSIAIFLSGCGATLDKMGGRVSLANDGSVLLGARTELKLSLEETSDSDSAPKPDKSEIYNQKGGKSSLFDQTLGVCGIWKF